MTRKKPLVLMLVVAVLTCWCRSDGIMEMLSPFIDLEELAEQAAKDVANGGSTEPVDRTFPLAVEEMNALMQIYRDCRTKESAAMRTWCTGGGEDFLFETMNSTGKLCPPGVKTHPCTGRVLHDNRTYEDANAKFLWPWEGLRCDAFTDPTTVTHIYLPGETLTCELASLDLSVMVSLEQLNLSQNKLYGEFPEWLGDMTMLRLLNLEGNQLSGDILASFAGNDALELINLSSNNLTATTLAFFNAFKRLQYLNLSNNKFVLELSRNVFASEFLRIINFSYNGFHGELPQLPIYPFLEIFDVSTNLLTGSIPAHLTLWGREDPHDPGEDSVLAIFDVSNNLFTGDLPTMSNQSALTRFDVRNNNFGGILPEFPPTLLLDPADFGGNAFTCPMPPMLLPGSLTCVCGNGYTILLNKATVNDSSHGNADESGVIQHLIPADQAAGICLPCQEGYYSNATTNQKCLPCPAGTSSDVFGGAVDHCKLCDPGTYAKESASSSCEPCPPGTSASESGATSCDPCYPGQYAANQGSINCTVCGVGTFSSSSGATVCTPCEVGTFVSTEAEAECLLCPKGAFQDVIGSVGCKACPVGYIAPQPGHAKCLPCASGSYFDVDAKTCILCSPGTFTMEAARTECSACENGAVADGFGNRACVGAAAPGSGYTGSTTRLECDAGTFNDGTSRSCQPCPPGTFAADRGSQECLPCPTGSFASRKGSVSCEEASSGSFVQFEGAVRAELCPPNSVASRKGSTGCTPCRTSSFSFLAGGVECSLAEPGEVYDHVEWPCLALDLAGVDHHDLFDTTNGQTTPMDVLLKLWMDTLSSYSGSTRTLHVLQVSQHFELTYATRIVVAVEMTTFSRKTDGRLGDDIGDAIHEATEAAESALGDLLNTLGRSNSDDENDVEKLRNLVMSSSLRDTLVRQFDRANLFAGALSFSMMNISMIEPQFKSTRAVPCDPGTFFSSSGESERTCLPCSTGSYSSTSGSLICERCPRGTFSPKEGLELCQPCPVGTDAPSGASSCEECSWFTYECEGFWQDLIAAVCVAITLLRMLFKKIRTLSVGDQAAQEQDASRALMAAVRSHGRTFDGVRYAPMGVISADTMFGSVSSTDKRLPTSRMQN